MATLTAQQIASVAKIPLAQAQKTLSLAGNIQGNTVRNGTLSNTSSGNQKIIDSIPVNQTITADTVGTTPQINIPNYPTTSPPSNIDSILSPYTVPTTTETPKSTDLQDRTKNLMTLVGLAPKKESVFNDREVQRQNRLIEENKQTVNTLTGNLNNIVANAQANVLRVTGQGRGIPEAIIGGQQAQIQKEAAIAALPIQAQISVAQGNLELAQSHLDTLFKMKTEEINNDYAYKLQVYDSVKNFLNREEEIQLKKVETAENRAYNEKINNLKTMDEWSQIAVKTGQSGLISSFSNLNPASPTFQSDISKIISRVQDPNVKLDLELKRAELAFKQKQTALLGEPTAKEKKEEALALKSAQGQNDILREKVNLIDSILDSGGISSRVGTNLGTRKAEGLTGNLVKLGSVVGIPSLIGDVKSGITGQGQQFSGGVHKLASREFLDALINAKQSGATFGALTDREGDALRASATQLNDWELKDKNGLGIGIWDIDEASFRKELENLKRLANLSIQRSTGSILDTSEQSVLDNAFQEQTNSNPANFYK